MHVLPSEWFAILLHNVLFVLLGTVVTENKHGLEMDPEPTLEWLSITAVPVVLIALVAAVCAVVTWCKCRRCKAGMLFIALHLQTKHDNSYGLKMLQPQNPKVLAYTVHK